MAGPPLSLEVRVSRPDILQQHCDLAIPNKPTLCDSYDLREQIMWQPLKFLGSLGLPSGEKESDFQYFWKG